MSISRPGDLLLIPTELAVNEHPTDVLEEMEIPGAPADGLGLRTRFADDARVAGVTIRGRRVFLNLRDKGDAGAAARAALERDVDMRRTR